MTIDSIDAPWNHEELPEEEIEVTVCISLSKTFKIKVDDYKAYSGNYDDPRDVIKNFTDCDLNKAVEKQVVLPHNLAEFTEKMFDHDLDLKAAKMPRYLKNAVEDCKNWNIDDFNIFHEV